MRTFFNDWWDQRDRRRAEQWRAILGQRLWLVSWSSHRKSTGACCFLARVSCPQFEATVARVGRSRNEAIRRAVASLQLLLSECHAERAVGAFHR
jgi:hypothetical protein